jgi:hypothetical protein
VRPAELSDARTAARASLWAWGDSGDKLVAGVDVEEAGVGMAVVEDVEADVDADAGSDAIAMPSSSSLCSDVIDPKNDRRRCK